MDVRNNLLFKDNSQAEYIQSPNTSGQAQMVVPSYIVMHYTGDSSIEGTIDWFKKIASEASAHIVIGRDGRVVQMVPFNQKAWHAGKSSWGNIVGLNSYSVGIELVNAGKLVRKKGNYVNLAGRVIPDDEVIQATHKNETAMCFWQEYTQAQLDAAAEVSKAIVSAYSILEILGHDDIAPLRKSDPGPAFPMSAFTSRVFGRAG